MTLQDNLRRAIRAENAWRKWSDSELAEQIGLSQASFSQRMNQRDFRINEIEAISKQYGVRTSELIARAERNQEQEKEQEE